MGKTMQHTLWKGFDSLQFDLLTWGPYSIWQTNPPYILTYVTMQGLGPTLRFWNFKKSQKYVPIFTCFSTQDVEKSELFMFCFPHQFVWMNYLRYSTHRNIDLKSWFAYFFTHEIIFKFYIRHLARVVWSLLTEAWLKRIYGNE